MTSSPISTACHWAGCPALSDEQVLMG